MLMVAYSHYIPRKPRFSWLNHVESPNFSAEIILLPNYIPIKSPVLLIIAS